MQQEWPHLWSYSAKIPSFLREWVGWLLLRLSCTRILRCLTLFGTGFISIFPWLLKETKRWERPRKTFCGFSRHNGRFLWACLKYLANHVANRSCDNWLIGSKCLLGRGCKVRLAIFPLVDVFNSYRTVKGCWRQFFWSRWSFTSGKNCRWPWLFFKEGLNNRS